MTTVRSLLAAHDVPASDETRREAEILLGHVLQKPRAWLYAHRDDAIIERDAEMFREMLKKRAEGMPVAYLVGHREFWSMDLVVNPAVLIPRPDTELLVERALLHIPQGEKVDIVDLGTGSGAIALALARERPHARVLATDTGEAALAVARNNAQRLEIRNVEFVRSDWFDGLGGRAFDVMVSNPPYIASGDAHLSHGDLRFEPSSALVSGADGLDAIRTIVRHAPPHLKADGRVLIEHGFEQGEAVRAILAQRGFVDISTMRDDEERERVTAAAKPPPQDRS